MTNQKQYYFSSLNIAFGGCGISSNFLCLKTSLRINVAYNYDPGWFAVFNNAMHKYSNYFGLKNEVSRIPYDFEILEIFFKTNNIIVNWINCYSNWGLYDDEKERWTGAVGKVEMNTYTQGITFFSEA